MIRFFLAMTFLVLYLIFTLPVMGVFAIIKKFDPEKIDRASLHMVKFVLKGILLFSGAKVTVIGRENIPENHEPVLFVGNHRSFFDIVIGYSMMKDVTGFVAKKEMNNVPSMRLWMRFIHCVFLDRKNTREGMKAIVAGIDNLKNGISMIVFPEGTCNETEDPLLPFHEGSMKLATKSGVRIVPMVQCNTEGVFDKAGRKLHPLHTVIEFGEPIDVTSLSAENQKHLGAYMQGVIEEMYRKNLPLV